MSGELVPAGGGEVVPATTGGAVGEHIGDLSLHRGDAPRVGAVARPELVRELQGALGFDISPAGIQKAREVLERQRLAQDKRQNGAAVTEMRAEWAQSTRSESPEFTNGSIRFRKTSKRRSSARAQCHRRSDLLRHRSPARNVRDGVELRVRL